MSARECWGSAVETHHAFPLNLALCPDFLQGAVLWSSAVTSATVMMSPCFSCSTGYRGMWYVLPGGGALSMKRGAAGGKAGPGSVVGRRSVRMSILLTPQKIKQRVAFIRVRGTKCGDSMCFPPMAGGRHNIAQDG